MNELVITDNECSHIRLYDENTIDESAALWICCLCSKSGTVARADIAYTLDEILEDRG